MKADRDEIRLALPSKGRLAEDALELLAKSGFKVHKPNPRQYAAAIPDLPGVTVLFQRAGDIVVSVRDGSVDFGITGWDVVSEYRGENDDILTLHKELGFGYCSLNVIIPEELENIKTILDLNKWQKVLQRPLRIATKFPNLTKSFFHQNGLQKFELIQAEGTLEIAPTIGYADLIIDLVSTGTTLRDNRLKAIEDGLILKSQASLIANRARLKNKPIVLDTARRLLEFIVAYLRAAENLSVFANMRGNSAEAIAHLMFRKSIIGGLQGPTISPIITRQDGNWFAAHIVVRKNQLAQAIKELREVGGSGVVVSPVNYIFEEEPEAYLAMVKALEE